VARASRRTILARPLGAPGVAPIDGFPVVPSLPYQRGSF